MLSIKKASNTYQKQIQALQQEAVLGIALLGVGTDGHTASIFPDQLDTLPKQDKIVFMTPEEKNGYYRMSVNYSLLFDMSYAIFYVPGLEKKEIVSLLEDPNDIQVYPAKKVLYEHANSYLLVSK